MQYFMHFNCKYNTQLYLQTKNPVKIHNLINIEKTISIAWNFDLFIQAFLGLAETHGFEDHKKETMNHNP